MDFTCCSLIAGSRPYQPAFFIGNSDLAAKKFSISTKYILPTLVAVIPIGIQMIVWYLQNGSLLNWSYPGEGFRFDEPYFFAFLFSFQNGAFVYTPLLFIAVIASLYLIVTKEFRFIGMMSLLTFMVVVYIMSCWWVWHFDSIFVVGF